LVTDRIKKQRTTLFAIGLQRYDQPNLEVAFDPGCRGTDVHWFRDRPNHNFHFGRWTGRRRSWPSPRESQVNCRETNQQNRIANGVKNGSLSPKQTSNLEKREANVQSREKKDMVAHNGHLTKAEHNGINRQQNRISKSI
jgi:hypothetical protein